MALLCSGLCVCCTSPNTTKQHKAYPHRAINTPLPAQPLTPSCRTTKLASTPIPCSTTNHLKPQVALRHICQLIGTLGYKANSTFPCAYLYLQGPEVSLLGDKKRRVGNEKPSRTQESLPRMQTLGMRLLNINEPGISLTSFP